MRRGDGKAKDNRRTLPVRFDLHLAVELADPFAHAPDSDTRAPRLNLGQPLRGDSLALIFNADADTFGVAGNPDRPAFAAGMTMDVGQAFLDQAER